MKKIIAVTGCPTGIAHTFMAEEALKTAAKKLNVDIKVETMCAAIGVLTADLDRLRIYRYFARPLTLLACSFCFVSVMFIIPVCPSSVNLYGYFIDGYKLIMWGLFF